MIKTSRLTIKSPLKMYITKYLSVLFLVTTTTVIGYVFFNSLALTGISMLYLLLIVSIAYYSPFFLSVAVACTSFLLINYFFVEPRFTFQVGHIASWTSLLSFLIVSVVITSLVKRLKLESIQSQQAFRRAEFSRKLAENLAYAIDLPTMLEDCRSLLQQEFEKSIWIIDNKDNVTEPYQLSAKQRDAIAWVQANGKQFGPSTGNWPESNYWIIPFNRLPSHDPVVIILEVSDSEKAEVLNSITSATDQIAIAYQHQIQKQKTLKAETQAREESIKSALLASIAHDMRTPLTSILGAATTLNQTEIRIKSEDMRHLTAVIASQAKHLARTTENILSLIRLESVSKDAIPMDFQSPEEIVGILSELYRHQTDAPKLSILVSAPDSLIHANPDLVILALTNLIENAKQANIQNNLPNAVIQINVLETEDQVHIQVSDNGGGFAEGFSVKDIRKFESGRDKGFGLGLSIVDAVAKIHHAELTFKKGINNGAIVSLIFNKANIDLAHVE